MTFIKKNIWTILSLTLVMVLSMTGGASAASVTGDDSIEGIALDKGVQVFKAARNIMFVIGGFGLVAVAFAAIAGKMNWKWVGSLAIGLGIIAAASAVIDYVTGDGLSGGVNNEAFEDTLK
ncbi:MAG: TrbC/VirB2 family protein [Alphaproteobacteria bacterium]